MKDFKLGDKISASQARQNVSVYQKDGGTLIRYLHCYINEKSQEGDSSVSYIFSRNDERSKVDAVISEFRSQGFTVIEEAIRSAANGPAVKIGISW